MNQLNTQTNEVLEKNINTTLGEDMESLLKKDEVENIKESEEVTSFWDTEEVESFDISDEEVEAFWNANPRITDKEQSDIDFFVSESLSDSQDINHEDLNYWQKHPIMDEQHDLPDVFQQEFADWYFQNQAQIDDPPLQPLQSPIFELSIPQGLRNLAQGAIDFSAYVSPFYGGDSWWNGFGKGRKKGEELGQKLLTLPNLRTPGGALDKSVQLVTEYFAPAGMAVKGTKLFSQLLSGSDDIAKFAGKFSRGENIGAFAIGFGAVDMALVDPNMQNLAAMLKDNPKLEGPVSWFLDKLATDPDNPEWQNRFVRTIEGMGIGFTFEGALWFSKVVTTGVSKGTIAVVKPLDKELYQYMKTNMPEEITFAQHAWRTLQEFNPKEAYHNFVWKYSTDLQGVKLITREADQTKKLISVERLRSKELLDEYQRIKKLYPDMDGSQARALAEENLGIRGTAGHNAWVEFKLLKNVGQVIKTFLDDNTLNWRGLDAQGKEILDYSRLPMTGEGLTPSIAKFIKTTTQKNDFAQYLVAKRALKLHERGFKPKEILKNYNQKKLEKYAKLGDNNIVFQNALKSLQSYNKRLLDFAVDSGLLSRESVDAMLKANPVYVPFYRITTSITDEGLLKASIQTSSAKSIKKFKGGGGLIQDPYQSLIQNTGVIVDAALRNRANQTLVETFKTVRAVRKQDAIRLADEQGLKGQDKKNFIKHYQNKWAEPMTSKDALGYANIDKKSLKKQLENAGIKEVNIDEADDFISLVHFNKRNIKESVEGKQILIVKNNGKAEYWKINDKMISHVVEQFGYKAYHEMETAMKLVNMQKRYYSSMITYRPGFAFWSNPGRDSLGGAITSTSWSRLPIFDVPINAYRALKGVWGTTPEDHKMFLEYKNNGGGFGTIYTQNIDAHATQVKKYFNKKLNIPLEDVITNPKKFVEWYPQAVTAMEHATRLSEFKRMLKLGYSEREAAIMSREISIDFSEKGSSAIINGINHVVPFFNPYVQGLSKSLRTIKERPIQTFAKVNMYVGMPTMALWHINHNNPTYQAYPDYIKRQAWFIPVGTVYDERLREERTRYILIPKPFDIWGAYANVVEAGLNAGYKTFEEKAGSDNASLIMSKFVQNLFASGDLGVAGEGLLPPLPLPPVVTLGFAMVGNYDTFTGASIIPKRLEGVPAEFQFSPWTSEMMQLLGEKTGVSPMQIEQVYKGFFPGWGEDMLHLADYFTNVYTNDKYNPNEELKPEHFPILDRAYTSGIPKITQYELDMFDELEDGLDNFLSESQIIEIMMFDEERIKNWFKDKDNQLKISRRPVLFKYLQDISTLNASIRKTSRDKTLSNDSRNSTILKYQLMKKRLAKDALKGLEVLKRF
tara:strand:- start:617 stop:4690 length:4074 start_codon:yes stop_codon:yes gene_type:complete